MAALWSKDNLKHGLRKIFSTTFRCKMFHMVSSSRMFLRFTQIAAISFRFSHTNRRFVPKCITTQQYIDDSIAQLDELVEKYDKLFVLTGAGISTESGVRDYRSEGVGLYAVSESRPMDYRDFLRCPVNRQRYWARNYVGWPMFSSFEPNVNHFALAKLEQLGSVYWLVTQNVDALHTKAGSTRFSELHGCSHRVICLSCNEMTSRDQLQLQMQEMNPNWNESGQEQAPDGDVFVENEATKSFNVPSCLKCGGILKPDVVFFGGSVPKSRVQEISDRLAECNAVLVIGSAVETFSAYRYMLAASESKKPIVILNIGPTRADKLASLKITAVSGDILPQLKCLRADSSRVKYSGK